MIHRNMTQLKSHQKENRSYKVKHDKREWLKERQNACPDTALEKNTATKYASVCLCVHCMKILEEYQ
jgi:hypothetical protein